MQAKETVRPRPFMEDAAYVLSQPFTCSYSQVAMPAFFMRIFSRSSSRSARLAKATTLLKLARSMIYSSAFV